MARTRQLRLGVCIFALFACMVYFLVPAEWLEMEPSSKERYSTDGSGSAGVTPSSTELTARAPSSKAKLSLPSLTDTDPTGFYQLEQLLDGHKAERDFRSAMQEEGALQRGDKDERETAQRAVVAAVDRLLAALQSPPHLPVTHTSFIAVRDYVLTRLVEQRYHRLNDTTLTSSMEFLRLTHHDKDAIYRVPTVPWNSTNLARVELKHHGLYATFDHIAAPVTTANRVRVAVQMSGHMRTFRKCQKSLVENILKPNDALLFIATYPDIGDKRFGIRFQDRDDPVPVDEVAATFAPYLAGVYMLDAPTVTQWLTKEFPSYFYLKQWSWMIYQLFSMDVVHRITMAHILHSKEYTEFHKNDASQLTKVLRSEENRSTWSTFDVVIRVRPDLYILGPIWILRHAVDPQKYSFNFTCGGHHFVVPFGRNEIVRSPHHPYIEWDRDRLSDHSAVGLTEDMSQFVTLFSSVLEMSERRRSEEVFMHGNTAERMWSQHAGRINMKLLESAGWHIMLRNKEKWENSTHVIGKGKMRQWVTQMVFGVSDPSTVPCPSPSGERWTKPPKPAKGVKGTRRH